VYLYLKGLWQGSGRANRKGSDRTGWVESQQVVEGGGGINKCYSGGYCHFPATTISGINTPHVPTPVILHPPALEDGTDRGFRNVGF